jgi:hypothetical protein
VPGWVQTVHRRGSSSVQEVDGDRESGRRQSVSSSRFHSHLLDHFIFSVSNQYICPVFKWGTNEEWEFGLQRVIKFPPNRKQNERTYLLKTLAGCPNEAEKIERLLNITILEQNGNFTDNDVYLIFSMLTGSANGYTTLFNFLKKNWDTIKVR